MTLNKANLFQLTQNSQLSITVSVHVCVPMYMPCLMWLRAYHYTILTFVCDVCP